MGVPKAKRWRTGVGTSALPELGVRALLTPFRRTYFEIHDFENVPPPQMSDHDIVVKSIENQIEEDAAFREVNPEPTTVGDDFLEKRSADFSKALEEGKRRWIIYRGKPMDPYIRTSREAFLTLSEATKLQEEMSAADSGPNEWRVIGMKKISDLFWA